MKKFFKEVKKIWEEHQFFWELIIVTIIILTIGFLAISCEEEFEKKRFKACECGGHWEYQQAVGHQASTSYIYKCDKCGNIVEFDNYYKEERED